MPLVPGVWSQHYVSCAGDPVPSPAGDRVDGHRELVGGGLPLQGDGLSQVSRVRLLSCHCDQPLLQNIRLLRIRIHPHRHLLGQVRGDDYRPQPCNIWQRKDTRALTISKEESLSSMEGDGCKTVGSKISGQTC